MSSSSRVALPAHQEVHDGIHILLRSPSPRLIPDDETWSLGQGQAPVKLAAKWRETSQLLSLAGHKLILEEGPETLDEENQRDDHGDDMLSRISTQAQRIERA
jgi:hypothetical protein